MNAIAHGYIQGREKWPSRAAGYQAIKKKFVERADRESREGSSTRCPAAADSGLACCQ
jgi:hypothetical protein